MNTSGDLSALSYNEKLRALKDSMNPSVSVDVTSDILVSLGIDPKVKPYERYNAPDFIPHRTALLAIAKEKESEKNSLDKLELFYNLGLLGLHDFLILPLDSRNDCHPNQLNYKPEDAAIGAETMLQMAVQNFNYPLVSKLLEMVPDCVNPSGMFYVKYDNNPLGTTTIGRHTKEPPLTIAAKKGDGVMVDMLLKAGADCGVAFNGSSPVAAAANPATQKAIRLATHAQRLAIEAADGAKALILPGGSGYSYITDTEWKRIDEGIIANGTALLEFLTKPPRKNARSI